VVSSPRGLDASRIASLTLFAILAAVAMLASRGRLPLPAGQAARDR
jgi:hypothetical protein